MSTPASARLERIDTLRGVAVFGILTVNVWGMATGSMLLRYGVLDAAASGADQLAIFLVAALAEAKFYPIFAFLFGAGFALQMRALRRASGALEPAKAIYRRRLAWLLVCGLLHGSLLWYGDILNSYAVTGFWLLSTAGRPLRKLRRLLIGAAAINLALLALGALVMLAMDEQSIASVNETVYDATRMQLIFSVGGWDDVALARLKNFGMNLLNLPFFVPELAMLFLAGVFAVRLGCLTRPARHRRFWRGVLLAGFGIGLPWNLWWASLALGEARDPYQLGQGALFGHAALSVGGTLLAAGYVAALMLAGPRLARALAAVFAPAGRMALSNYLLQSVLGMLTLQGVGLGWGGQLSRAGLLAWCGAIMLVQLAWSRWWLARHGQGPFEAAWRRYVYPE
ncbi:MAG: DUF418 domain-containing protein [Pseudomonadota bacterium]